MRRKSSARATRSRRRLLSGLEVLGGFGGVADTLNIYNHYLGDPGYLHEGSRAASRGDAGEREGVRADLPQARRARRGATACPATPDLGPPVPTPPAPKVAPGTGAEAVNADEAWREGPAEARGPAADHAADAAVVHSCRTA